MEQFQYPDGLKKIESTKKNPVCVQEFLGVTLMRLVFFSALYFKIPRVAIGRAARLVRKPRRQGCHRDQFVF